MSFPHLHPFINHVVDTIFSTRSPICEMAQVAVSPIRVLGGVPVYSSVELFIMKTRQHRVAHELGPSVYTFLFGVNLDQSFEVWETRGASHFVVVPQDRYRPPSSHYSTIYFLPFSINGVVGIDAQAAYRGLTRNLDYAGFPVLAEMSARRPSCRLQPTGLPSWSHQFYVKYNNGPVSLAELATRVACEVKRYLHEKNYRRNPASMDDIILLGVTKVSDGSIQVELALKA
ncbi:hypothetical protein WOLCODRAFT_156867 [Wolfiporia cocos MD-104 SS10]|uniref:Uncharacterized protein n=1 Tax=Wolfiporia cocos (strain MD-104) TaxID=742152 RepID=A0A2H3J1K2_WOLCO|nr:hypothetical protein WOLCODRAFT_156867 [Wolfiporia cocos MD-104 SS10]